MSSLGRIGIYIKKGGVWKLEIGRWSCHWAVGARIAGIGGLQKLEGDGQTGSGRWEQAAIYCHGGRGAAVVVRMSEPLGGRPYQNTAGVAM